MLLNKRNRPSGKLPAVLCALCVVTLFPCSSAVGEDNGVPFSVLVGQTDNNTTGVLLFYMTYLDTSVEEETCYEEQDWCCKTSMDYLITHWHLDGDNLTSSEKSKADTFFELYWGYSSSDRVSSADGEMNCHGYSTDKGVVVIDIWTLLTDDYYSVEVPQVADIVLYAYPANHTAVISEICGTTTNVRGKGGVYGVYETGISEQGTPSTYWR
jgi:hypothetical protein